MKIVPREIPKDAEDIVFIFKDDETFGMINLCSYRIELEYIVNYKIIINENSDVIKIHFPLYEYYYVKEYREPYCTFAKLVELIYDTGVEAMTYDIQKNPQRYKYGLATKAKDVVDIYALTYSGRYKSSDIKILGNNIYVEVQE